MTAVVSVDLADRGYEIEIGSGNLQTAGPFVKAKSAGDHVVLITDSHVDPLYGDPCADHCTEVGLEVTVITVDPGETSKSIEVAASIWETMLEEGADRQSTVVAVGGGVVGDLAGFVAATFARGVPLIQIPTTLLAQVDSSVGGKTGINLPLAKNMVGAFWQPQGVLIDVDVLATLPDREYRAGLAEVVKYGVIMDEPFFTYLEEHVESINARDAVALAHIVQRCCELKAEVVISDERETTGRRSILNYGHTYCHAFEVATGYSELLHGEAVARGMTCAARLATRLGRVDDSLESRQTSLLNALGLVTEPPDCEPNEIVALMRRDKKAVAGQLRLVLPTRLGHVELVKDVDAELVRAALVPGPKPP